MSSTVFARALSSRNYRLYFAGQFVSLAGTWMQQIAMVWLAYRLSDSALVLGIVGFASQIPILLLGPVTGVWTDRYDRRRILLVTQTLAMLQALLLAFLAFDHRAGPATLVALASNSDDPVYAGSDAVDGWIDIAGINDFSNVNGGFWGSLWSAELDQLSARMSPTRFVDAQDPPGYVIHGDDDGLVPASHSLALKDEADRRGARVSLDVVDAWSDQAWMPDRFRNHVPTGGVNVDALNRFLDGL